MNKIEDWLTLLRTPGLKPDQYHQLLDIFGSPEKVFGAGRASLGKLGLKVAALMTADIASGYIPENPCSKVSGSLSGTSSVMMPGVEPSLWIPQHVSLICSTRRA